MRTLLVDDHALFRDGVASLLLAWGHEVVGQASDGAEAIELADETSPEVILMDVRMPNVSGLEATAQIKQRHPEVAIVMLTVSEEEADLFRAIKAGAQGYLLKNLEAPQLRSMLEGVARGEPAITPATAARIIDEFLRTPGTSPQANQRLTDRELEVLKALTEGLATPEICERLYIAPNTLRTHVQNIMGKLRVHSKLEAVAFALRHRLVEPPKSDDNLF